MHSRNEADWSAIARIEPYLEPLREATNGEGRETEWVQIVSSNRRNRMLRRITFAFVAAVVLASAPAYAECNPYFGGGNIDYLEYERSNYTICYGTTSQHLTDRNIVRKWVDEGFALGREKYNVTKLNAWGHDLEFTVYLPPTPTSATYQGYVQFTCCYEDRNGMQGDNGRALHHAEIHYLTPSAWQGENLGGLQTPKSEYHAHYVMHEMIHLFQHACCRQEAYEGGYDVPLWITEGMAESDGYRHTTEYGRTTAQEKLGEKFLDDELGEVMWGRSLDLERAFNVTSVYWAGGFVMNHLAETYGDAIHYELLKDEIGTVLERYESSLTDLFVDLLVLVEELEEEESEDEELEDTDAAYWQFTSADAPVRGEEPVCRINIVHP